METETKKTRGRPLGSKTSAPVIVNVEPSVCPKCGSTDRGNYFNIRSFDFPGILPDGRKYYRVVWRNCKCEGCGQVRVDRSHE